MAITGKSYVNISPGKLGAGMPTVLELAEGSSETGLRGSPVTITSGYVVDMAVGGQCFGFLAEPANNDTADGLSNIKVYRAENGRLFTGTLKATLTQAMIGSSVALSRGSSTAYLDTATATSTHNCVVIGPVPPFAVGDTNPVVYFQVIGQSIEGEEDVV